MLIPPLPPSVGFLSLSLAGVLLPQSLARTFLLPLSLPGVFLPLSLVGVFPLLFLAGVFLHERSQAKSIQKQLWQLVAVVS
jgi:hypothetical protein